MRQDLFDEQAERAMSHIELARWADYFLIAPLSANCLAKLANGLADDLLSTLYLVCDVPVIVCPAMNHSMWSHPAVQNNMEVLSKHGVVVLGPAEGSQACGEFGLGRMREVDSIIDALRLVSVKDCLKGKEVLITAGPTREAIDPVRYISNRSSGKMGYALAKACTMAGAKVTLVSGPTDLSPPDEVERFVVETAQEMFQKVQAHLTKGMIFISSAAVGDFSAKQIETQKIKRHNKQEMALNLVKNPDILAEVAKRDKAGYLVGFAAETENELEFGRKKRIQKQVDMIIANRVGKDLGFDKDEHEVTLITENKELNFGPAHKVRLAGEIIAFLSDILQNSAHK